MRRCTEIDKTFMNLKLNLEKANIDISEDYGRALSIFDELRQDREEFTGWVNWPCEISEKLIEEIEQEAKRVRELCDVLVVVGIGGSYLGTAAVAQAIAQRKKGMPHILFAGNSLSGERLARVVETVKMRNVCMCVVSKSGGTLETKIAYKTLRKIIEEKYGAEANSRIIAITDAETGALRKDVRERNYKSFEIPRNIGGRYSAFTPAILFPLAVVGADIRAFMRGAKDIASDSEYWREDGIRYALTRYALNKSGKDVEVFEYFEPSLQLLGEWLKQMFAESEGKDGKGLFPTTLSLSTDLHSVGQYLQEGKQMFFETIINVKNIGYDVALPIESGEDLSGLSVNAINQIAVDGVITAHSKTGTPIIKIELEDKKEYTLGQFLYFMMMTAGITGKLMEVDPFSQDGVEKYKSEIRTKLADLKGIK